MHTINNPSYLENGGITAEIDGEIYDFIPDDMKYLPRRLIRDHWESRGKVIAKFVVPEPDYKFLIAKEVERRIFAHASANTQMNMTAAATADLLNADQKEAYKQGLIWVSEMRAKGAELIASKTVDYEDDKHWPEPSAAAVALAKAF
jgi:hypothetical protein